MTESEALAIMVPPGARRPGKYREGVIQIHVTRACDKSCLGCTQGSQLAGKATFMSPSQFETAVLSLAGYFGVYGVFGGNPALSPYFADYCAILQKHVPKQQRGLWCNNPLGKASLMRETFDPSVSNLNVHLDAKAYAEFRKDWPECRPVGLEQDSRHAPPYVALRDVIESEPERWEMISRCPINLHWSAMLGVFRGEVRAWFCEIAGAQSILHQDDPGYPDTGLRPAPGWWRLPMRNFAAQVRRHCHDCGVPLNGYGELSQSEDGTEQVSQTHRAVFRPKRKGRAVELVTVRSQVEEGRIARMTDYLGNAKR